MSVKLFGAIYIGSYEVCLKIFEFSAKKKMHEIDYIRSRIDLGRDAYKNGTISYQLVEELCQRLSEYKSIMNGYKVNNYEVYASAVLRDIGNELFVLDQIFRRTGFEVKVLSNSEVRFLTYESIAGRDTFENLIKKSAAIIDVGGANIQITLFKNSELITTQHIETGTMRIYDLLFDSGSTEIKYKNRVEEYLFKKFEAFKSLYLYGGIDYVVFMNDYGLNLVNNICKENENTIKSKKIIKYLEELQKNNSLIDNDPFVIPMILIYKTVINMFAPEEVWIPGLNINDGIAFDYAYKNKLIIVSHDFDSDILSAARKLSEHFISNSLHIDMLSKLSKQIYHTTRKLHGLGKREELLLEVAAILHDCGKYVSFSLAPQSAYQIVMSSEIIGLTHLERQIVAYTILFNTLPLSEYSEISDEIDCESYMTIAKLSAILRVADALDQSYKQKIQNIKISIKNRELIFLIETVDDISLEKILFEQEISCFEKVFSVKPIIKEKRIY